MLGSAKIYNFFNAIFQNIKKIENVPAGTATKMYGEDSSGNLVKDDVPSGGASAFTELSDVPESYTDQAGKMLIVNENENALEFTDVPSGGALPEGTVDGSVLRWNDTSEKWEESEHINIADDNSIIVIGARDSENDNAHIIYTIDEFAKRNINLICIDPNNTDNLATISAVNRGIGGLGTCAVFLRAENNYFYIGESNAGSGIVYQDYSTGDVLFNVSTAGKLLSKYLAGTGNRLLYADTNGNITANTSAGLTGSCTISGQTLTFENGILVGASPALS